MKEKKKQLKLLMKKYNMNQSTIYGVLKLLQTEENIEKTIQYIEEYKQIINDHQLRQYMAEILIWDKE